MNTFTFGPKITCSQCKEKISDHYIDQIGRIWCEQCKTHWEQGLKPVAKLDPNVSLIGTKWYYTIHGPGRVLTVTKHEGEEIEVGDERADDCIDINWLSKAYTQIQ